MNILQQVKELSKKISGKIHYEYSMKNSNWFNVGGPAKIFFKPNNFVTFVFFVKKKFF